MAFDLIGDVHGCYQELLELLQLLGYEVRNQESNELKIVPPYGRQLVFVGDLIDRGPNSVAVLKLVMRAIEQKAAYCVIGNHDDKLMRKLMGHNVQIKNGLDTTLKELEKEPPHFSVSVRLFLESMPYYLWFDEKKMLVAHAGLPEKYHGQESKRVRELCLYGPTTGKPDEDGFPTRLNWAKDYQGKPLIVFGHTPVREPLFLNNTANIDTGCIFGGKLTALRYPEMETISVPARKLYAEPRRLF